jgi:bifunctional non-homologous end joining protein LigD
VTLDGHRLALSNTGKILFPESGVTKGRIIDYYRRVAKVSLPHFAERPLTMHRFPDGIAREGFFQKDVPEYFPDWIDRVRLDKQDGQVTYVVANDAATLVYLANQACITPHLSLARRDKPYHPDRMIFDLDPSDDDFEKVRRAALGLKDLFRRIETAVFVQTTGSRGLHVVVPLDRSATFDAARDFATRVANHLARAHPESLTTEQRKSARGDRVFLDTLRNAYGQTAVAPYAMRALEGAPVATPLDWPEVGKRELGPQSYSIANIFRRLAQKRDPWSSMDRRADALAAIRQRFLAHFGA